MASSSPTPSLLEKQDHLANSGANSALTDSSLSPYEDPQAVSFTEAEDRALVRKLDRTLIPGFTFLYLLSFLDRSNSEHRSLILLSSEEQNSFDVFSFFFRKVGNAKAAGMMTDIGLKSKPEAYNTALALFFLGYVLFEIPANVV